MSTMNMACDAFDTFYLGSHEKSGQLLEQISSSKGSYDVKVQHNKFINDYYKSGCGDPQVLLTELTQAHERVRDRDKKDNGRRKRDEDDEETYREDDDLSVLRYNQALLCLQLRQYAQASLILEDLFVNIEPIDDYLAIKICFLLLELCLLQREPEQAVAVLAYLEKPNAFLTVLRSERPKGVETRGVEDAANEDAANANKGGVDDDGGDNTVDASEALGAAELQAASGSGDKRNAAALATEEAAEGPLPSLTFGSFMPRHGRPPDTISRAEYRFYCLMYRARLSVALKNTKAAKKDVKNALEVLDQELRYAPLLTPHPHTTGAPGTKGDSPSEVALREALQHQHSAMVLTLKAYLEYTRQNVRKSIKLMTLCQFNFAEAPEGAQRPRPSKGGVEDGEEEPISTGFHPAEDPACAAVFFNNVGCIHFLMQKPNLATMYFQKALEAGKPAAPSGKVNGKHDNFLGGKAGLTLPGVLATKHWLDRNAEVSYNAGLQMLMSERPIAAYQSLERCIPVFRTWPRLWLRLAESCIEMHRGSLEPRGDAGEACSAAEGALSMSTAWSREAATQGHNGGGGKKCLWGIQGAGMHRRWLLTTTRDGPLGKRTGGDEDEAGAKGSAPPAPPPSPGSDGLMSSSAALSHAAMYLRNVLVLVAPMLPDRASGGSGKDGVSGKDAGLEAVATPAVATGSAATASGDKAATASTVAGAKASKSGAASTAGASGAKVPGSSSSSGSGSRHQARDLLQSEAALLEDAALVKLSYVCLCQHDHASALRYSRRVLEKNYLLMPASGDASKEEVKVSWTFQGQNFPDSTGTSPAKHPASVGCLTLSVMYLVEALVLAGKPGDAQTLLGGFVSGNAASRGLELQNGAFSESGGVVSSKKRASNTVNADATTLCGGLSPSTSMGGLTPPWHCAAGTGGGGSQGQKDQDGKGGDGEKEKASGAKDSGHAPLVMYPTTEMPKLGDAQCMLYTNLAALHAQDGNLAEAERCCEQALRLQPAAVAPMRSMVYILIRKGKHAQALERLKQIRCGVVTPIGGG